MATDRTKTPLCIRFQKRDLDAVRLAAARDGELPTVWIREQTMLRVLQLEQDQPVRPLKFRAGGVNGATTVRFRPADYRRVARAAARDGESPSAWVRAIAILAAGPKQQPMAAAVGAN